MKFFRTPEALMTPLFGMSKGDIFSTAKLRKGLENMRKLYGDFGFIDFVVEPSFEPMPNTGQIDLSLSVDEGKQFFVRRIDFSGNTTTRDKVIRRELLIDEGQIFNNRLWELSILRLNQLGYFEPLEGRGSRRHQARHQDQHRRHHAQGEGARQELHSVERRRLGHRRQLHRRFLFHQQLPRSGRNAEPQLAARHAHHVRSNSASPSHTCSTSPSQTGFTLYVQRFNYDQAREASILSGYESDPALQRSWARRTC